MTGGYDRGMSIEQKAGSDQRIVPGNWTAVVIPDDGEGFVYQPQLITADGSVPLSVTFESEIECVAFMEAHGIYPYHGLLSVDADA